MCLCCVLPQIKHYYYLCDLILSLFALYWKVLCKWTIYQEVRHFRCFCCVLQQITRCNRNLQLIFVTICTVLGGTLPLDLLPGSAPLYVFVLCISATCTLLGSCTLILSLFALYWEVYDTISVSGYPIDLTICLFGMFILCFVCLNPNLLFLHLCLNLKVCFEHLFIWSIFQMFVDTKYFVILSLSLGTR